MPQKKKPFVAGLIPPQWLGDGTGRSAAISSLWCGESVACSVCREVFSFVFRCLGRQLLALVTFVGKDWWKGLHGKMSGGFAWFSLDTRTNTDFYDEDLAHNEGRYSLGAISL
jgi:hypothetical protein